MTAKSNPSTKIQMNQKMAMQMNKGRNEPSGEPAALPAAKPIQSGEDRNRGKTAIVIN